MAILIKEVGPGREYTTLQSWWNAAVLDTSNIWHARCYRGNLGPQLQFTQAQPGGDEITLIYPADGEEITDLNDPTSGPYLALNDGTSRLLDFNATAGIIDGIAIRGIGIIGDGNGSIWANAFQSLICFRSNNYEITNISITGCVVEGTGDPPNGNTYLVNFETKTSGDISNVHIVGNNFIDNFDTGSGVPEGAFMRILTANGSRLVRDARILNNNFISHSNVLTNGISLTGASSYGNYFANNIMNDYVVTGAISFNAEVYNDLGDTKANLWADADNGDYTPIKESLANGFDVSGLLDNYGWTTESIDGTAYQPLYNKGAISLGLEPDEDNSEITGTGTNISVVTVERAYRLYNITNESNQVISMNVDHAMNPSPDSDIPYNVSGTIRINPNKSITIEASRVSRGTIINLRENIPGFVINEYVIKNIVENDDEVNETDDGTSPPLSNLADVINATTTALLQTVGDEGTDWLNTHLRSDSNIPDEMQLFDSPYVASITARNPLNWSNGVTKMMTAIGINGGILLEPGDIYITADHVTSPTGSATEWDLIDEDGSGSLKISLDPSSGADVLVVDSHIVGDDIKVLLLERKITYGGDGIQPALILPSNWESYLYDLASDNKIPTIHTQFYNNLCIKETYRLDDPADGTAERGVDHDQPAGAFYDGFRMNLGSGDSGYATGLLIPINGITRLIALGTWWTAPGGHGGIHNYIDIINDVISDMRGEDTSQPILTADLSEYETG